MMRWVLALGVGVWSVLANDTRAEESEPAMPVRQVKVFRSGVAFVQRSGDVDGDVRIELPFTEDQINDVLKSLVVLDLDGGQVGVVGYAPNEPHGRALKSFAIDLSSDPKLAELLHQLRGSEVTIRSSKQTSTIEGRIVGVEENKIVDPKSGEVRSESRLVVKTKSGLQWIDLSDISSVELIDGRLNKEFQQALEVLAMGVDSSRKPVTLDLHGKGRRHVVAAYVVEAPIWKTSYRLVLDVEDKPLFQGWATVDNTTDEDWNDVSLSLVSGRPISFVQDMYTPLYVPRPVVHPELYASLMPREHDRGRAIDNRAFQMQRADRSAGLAPPPPPAAESARSEGVYSMKSSMDDFSGSMADSVQAMATGADAGELFEYTIGLPVTLARQRSAMLPIVQSHVTAKKMSVFNQSVHAKHPMNVVKLKNTTGLNLLQGPLTIFDGKTYAGDGRLPDLSTGEERFVSYALDLERELTIDGGSDSRKLISVRLAKGVLISEHKQRRTFKYVVDNKDDDKREVVIEHPRHAPWKIVDTVAPEEETGELYRFVVQLSGSGTETLVVTEEWIQSQQFSLASMDENAMQVFLRSDVMSKSAQEALKHVVGLRNGLTRLERDIKDRENEIRTIDQEQSRLRKNMEAVPRESDIFARYMQKLSDQETRIEELRQELSGLQGREKFTRETLEAFIAGLDLK